jgi:hypothetical protein
MSTTISKPTMSNGRTVGNAKHIGRVDEKRDRTTYRSTEYETRRFEQLWDSDDDDDDDDDVSKAPDFYLTWLSFVSNDTEVTNYRLLLLPAKFLDLAVNKFEYHASHGGFPSVGATHSLRELWLATAVNLCDDDSTCWDDVGDKPSALFCTVVYNALFTNLFVWLCAQLNNRTNGPQSEYIPTFDPPSEDASCVEISGRKWLRETTTRVIGAWTKFICAPACIREFNCQGSVVEARFKKFIGGDNCEGLHMPCRVEHIGTQQANQIKSIFPAANLHTN